MTWKKIMVVLLYMCNIIKVFKHITICSCVLCKSFLEYFMNCTILFCSVLCGPLSLAEFHHCLDTVYRDSAINLNAFQAESVLPLDGGQPCMKYVLPIMCCWCMCVCLFMQGKIFLFSWPNTTDVLKRKVKKSRGLLLVPTELYTEKYRFWTS